MSADNFLAVLKEGDGYVGYHCSASMYYPQEECYHCIGSKDFEADTIEKAVDCCENFDAGGMGYLEYGYRFINRDRPLQERDYNFCVNCPQNPDNPEEGSEEAKALGCTCERILHNGDTYGYKMGIGCPVHLNPDWRGWSEAQYE